MKIKLIVLVVSSVLLSSCFDSKTEVATVGSEKPAAFAETDVITDAVVDDTGALEGEKTPELKEVQYSPNALDRLDKFISSNENSELPNKDPDTKGVNNQPISTDGKILLSPSKYAPAEDASYSSEERKIECKEVPNNYYCSDSFMLKVQQSKNKIDITGGGSVVLAPSAPKSSDNLLPSDAAYSLVYVKNNVVYPTAWFYSGKLNDTKNNELRYARVNGDACLYGSFYTLDYPDDFLYVCYKESPDGLEFADTEAIIFSEQTYDKPFTKTEIEKLPETNYSLFSKLIPQ